VKLTMATLALRDELAKVLAVCWHDGDEKLVNRRWDEGEAFQRPWLDRAQDLLFTGGTGAFAQAVDRVRREAFESGGSPAIQVLLLELQEAEPGDYQAGLARAVELLAQEMAQHYGSVFEAGLRVGREEASRGKRAGNGG
jgi:hypothetical protein